MHTCSFLLQNGTLWNICLPHCGFCEIGPSWDGIEVQAPHNVTENRICHPTEIFRDHWYTCECSVVRMRRNIDATDHFQNGSLLIMTGANGLKLAGHQQWQYSPGRNWCIRYPNDLLYHLIVDKWTYSLLWHSNMRTVIAPSIWSTTTSNGDRYVCCQPLLWGHNYHAVLSNGIPNNPHFQLIAMIVQSFYDD